MKNKKKFADIVVALCIAVSAVITAAVVWEYHRLDTVIPSGVLGALLGFWGGELLIIALRQIFGSDVVSQAKQTKTKSDDENMYWP